MEILRPGDRVSWLHRMEEIYPYIGGFIPDNLPREFGTVAEIPPEHVGNGYDVLILGDEGNRVTVIWSTQASIRARIQVHR